LYFLKNKIVRKSCDDMKIGVPKEIKNHENRVAMTPAGVVSLTDAGHSVYIESGAGLESGFTDRSEEHTSELQSRFDLVCRLLLDTAPSYIYNLSLHDALPISVFFKK